MSEEKEVQAPQEAQGAAEQAEAKTPEGAQQPLLTTGVGFLVMAFNDEEAADEALGAMKQAKKQKQFYFEDAAVIRQDKHGKVHYRETGDMGTGRGAGIGALVGGVLSLLGGPIGLAAGAGIGAAAGALASTRDSGFRNESLNTVGLALKPGTSAVAAITSHKFLRAVQKEVPIDRTRAAVSNLAAEISAALAQNKDLAIGVLLTEAGLAIKKIAVNEESAEVVGAVFTDKAVVAGAAVATAEGAAYEVVAATAEGAVMEAGVITEEGAVIVDAVAVPVAALPEAAAADEEKGAEEKSGAAEAPTDEAPAADAASA